MAEYIYIYSDGEPGAYGEPSSTAPRRAAQLGATPYSARNVSELVDLFTQFTTRSLVIDRMVIETHGSPGALYFGSDTLDEARLASFRGRGFADLFAENSRIFLNGCNVAATGKDCSGTRCTIVNGKAFLEAFARTFLSRAGGRVGASTSLGHVVPPVSAKVYHLNTTYYVYISRGGAQVRLAAGNELKSPEGDWHIPEGSDKWMYRFFANGTVRYQDENKFWGRINILDLEKTEGRWTREAAAVKVTWPSGTIETWELPLFDGYQPVTWNRFDGRVQSLTAKQWEYNDSTW
jgi:hypothetical protein